MMLSFNIFKIEKSYFFIMDSYFAKVVTNDSTFDLLKEIARQKLLLNSNWLEYTDGRFYQCLYAAAISEYYEFVKFIIEEYRFNIEEIKYALYGISMKRHISPIDFKIMILLLSKYNLDISHYENIIYVAAQNRNFIICCYIFKNFNATATKDNTNDVIQLAYYSHKFEECYQMYIINGCDDEEINHCLPKIMATYKQKFTHNFDIIFNFY